MTLYADIALPLPLDRSFTYSVPPELETRIVPGMRALVPFAGRTLTGFVVGIRRRRPPGGLKLKPVKDLPDDTPTFPPALLEFTRELGRASFMPWGEVLQAAVPPSFVPRSKACYSLTEKGRQALDGGTLADEEKAVVACLAARPHTVRYLERVCRLNGLEAVLERLRRKELIASRQELKIVKRRAAAPEPVGPRQLELDFAMDEASRRAAGLIGGAVGSGTPGDYLLFGPAAKRQAVYFEAIRAALHAGGRALLVVPEIARVEPFVEALESGLGEAPALVHGGLPEARREREWRRIRDGGVRVIVGSRLALFAPADNLRLVICDEEQDESFFQQEGLSYDVREAARLRAAGAGAVLVSGSEMPLVESFHRAREAGTLLDLGAAAAGPAAEIIAHDPGRGLISPGLGRALDSRLARREPAILFFNRRGYASSLVCPRCGHVPRCPRCSLPLSYHKREAKFVCHYCRYSAPATAACPNCGGRLVVRRAVGVEAAAEELKRKFPGRRVEIFATDEAGRKDEREALRLDFGEGRVDILVGTQFLAHQADFPRASLVGILHPEFGLRLADFRSAQRTFQGIVRELRFVSESAGAGAVVQTAAPDHFCIREAVRGNYPAFFEQELGYRRLMAYPPFSAMAAVDLLGPDLRKLGAAARDLAAHAGKAGPGITVFGPSVVPSARAKGLHRVQVVLKASRRDRLERLLREALARIDLKKTVVLSS